MMSCLSASLVQREKLTHLWAEVRHEYLVRHAAPHEAVGDPRSVREEVANGDGRGEVLSHGAGRITSWTREMSSVTIIILLLEQIIPIRTRRRANDGKYLETQSSRLITPFSVSIMANAAVTGFVIE